MSVWCVQCSGSGTTHTTEAYSHTVVRERNKKPSVGVLFMWEDFWNFGEVGRVSSTRTLNRNQGRGWFVSIRETVGKWFSNNTKHSEEVECNKKVVCRGSGCVRIKDSYNSCSCLCYLLIPLLIPLYIFKKFIYQFLIPFSSIIFITAFYILNYSFLFSCYHIKPLFFFCVCVCIFSLQLLL